jgi:hypothetical protein
MDRQTPERHNVTFKEWIQTGIHNNYIQPICLTHDFQTIWTTEERHRFDDLGDDPCVPRWIITRTDTPND